MYCNNCGKKVADGVAVCPECNTQLPSNFVSVPVPAQQPVYTAPPVQTAQPVQEARKPANPKSKGYAAIMSALLAFPMLVCLMMDYLGAPPLVHKILDFFDIEAEILEQGNMDWSLYLLGFVMCIWMAAVLPALKPKYPAVTACCCLAVISLYMLLLGYINDGAEWYRDWVLPIFLMITLSSAVMSILISYKIIKGNHIATAIGIQIALLTVGFEILSDTNIFGEVNLRFSLIAAVSIIGAVMIYEAVNYTVKINKK